MTGNYRIKKGWKYIIFKMKQLVYICVLSGAVDCSQWLLLTATADTISKHGSYYLLVLIAKIEKLFHDIFKQLVRKESKLWSLLMQKMWAENGLKNETN